MGFYEPAEGDEVRVILQGRARNVSKIEGHFAVGLNRILPGDKHVMSVEKVEPPVVTFKPGDTVRLKAPAGYVYSIGTDGYFDHTARRYNHSTSPFTSDSYELVELK